MDELMQMKMDLLKVTTELISPCRYCTMITTNPDMKAPIQCTKFAGSSQPIKVNVATCLSCKEYNNKTIPLRTVHAS